MCTTTALSMEVCHNDKFCIIIMNLYVISWFPVMASSPYQKEGRSDVYS